jgi:hypothetical protein
MKCLLLAAAFCLAGNLSAQTPALPAAFPLPSTQWTGAAPAPEPGAFHLSGEATYRVPDGPQGWYHAGLKQENDGTLDLRPWYGLRFEVQPDRDDLPYTLEVKVSIPPQPGRQNWISSATGHTRVQGGGWRTVTVPFADFDYNRGQVYFLKFIKELALTGGYDGAAAPGESATIRNLRLVRADVVSLDSPVLSQPAEAGETVTYPITVTNAADTPQVFALTLQHSGWEAFPAEISPAIISLPPGGTSAATLRVTVPNSPQVPPAAREKQTVCATPQGGDPRGAVLVFTTLRRVPSPFLQFDPAGWQAVRDKIARYDWAKAALAADVARADAWQVDEVPPGGIKSTGGTPALFRTYEAEGNAANAGHAWKLTGDRRFAEKAALFLRRMSDPATGYPHTLHATAGDLPQEGGFFAACAEAYDAIQDAGVLSDGDRRQIEQSFRLYVGVIADMMGDGGISNWSVFNLGPAVKCALILQDLERADALLNGPCGLVDQLRYGLMDDGWWYEVSLAYNIGCAHEFTSTGLALQAFGDDFLQARFPVATTSKVGLRPFEFQGLLGMAFGKDGPVKDNYVTIRKFWDGIAAYPDYRGIMFGMGDGHEQALGGGAFELAYYAFRDPAYAGVIKRSGQRDLLYGVPELPAETPELFRTTALSENAGVAVLRSQTAGRPISDQIQAAMKFGTHGSYHGHFDNISLLSLMRNGRSFFSPETSWFGYGSYMYKWWVQTSVAQNMVVVDGKMQEPRGCRTLLFHHGPMLQAIAAETTARWSNPPYFGGEAQIALVASGEVPFVPVPASHPLSGELTAFTEPVRQRRLIAVTDDYVVLADALQGENEHTFDDLMQLRGALLPAQPNVTDLGPMAQFDPNPLSSGQFITGCEHYAVTAPALVESLLRIGGTKAASDSFDAPSSGQNLETGGAKSLSEPGILHIDEHVLWPARSEIVLGRYAESWRVNKKLVYEVRADDRPLASGVFGAWNLGAGTVDVDVTGARTLRLSTQVTRPANTLKTIFWGDAAVLTASGERIPLAKLKCTTANVVPVPTPDGDYEGGPVRIAGVAYATSTAAEPQDAGQPAIITVDLTGVNAVRFQATVGGDWPVGNEEQVRKTVAVRAHGKDARFLTLLEPYESRRLVKSATATGPDQLRVELADGRTQELTITGLDGPDGSDAAIVLRETAPGHEPRQEIATGTQP